MFWNEIKGNKILFIVTVITVLLSRMTIKSGHENSFTSFLQRHNRGNHRPFPGLLPSFLIEKDKLILMQMLHRFIKDN